MLKDFIIRHLYYPHYSLIINNYYILLDIFIITILQRYINAINVYRNKIVPIFKTKFKYNY